MSPDTPIWLFLLPSGLLGIANAGIWAPLSRPRPATCRRAQAGAGSGIYNTTRQIGAVLGSAAIAVADPGPAGGRAPPAGASQGANGVLPAICRPSCRPAFSTAMGAVHHPAGRRRGPRRRPCADPVRPDSRRARLRPIFSAESARSTVGLISPAARCLKPPAAESQAAGQREPVADIRPPLQVRPAARASWPAIRRPACPARAAANPGRPGRPDGPAVPSHSA